MSSSSHPPHPPPHPHAYYPPPGSGYPPPPPGYLPYPPPGEFPYHYAMPMPPPPGDASGSSTAGASDAAGGLPPPLPPMPPMGSMPMPYPMPIPMGYYPHPGGEYMMSAGGPMRSPGGAQGRRASASPYGVTVGPMGGVDMGGNGEGADSKKPATKKTEVACEFCRRRKLKCDGARPECQQCVSRELACNYDTGPPRRRGPGRKNRSLLGMSEELRESEKEERAEQEKGMEKTRRNHQEQLLEWGNGVSGVVSGAYAYPGYNYPQGPPGVYALMHSQGHPPLPAPAPAKKKRVRGRAAAAAAAAVADKDAADEQDGAGHEEQDAPPAGAEVQKAAELAKEKKKA